MACVASNREMTNPGSYFDQLQRVIHHMPLAMVDEIVAALMSAYESGVLVCLFGNGGSAALASHFACDLGKGTTDPASPGKRFRALALTDNIPLLTAWANDLSYEEIFAQQIFGLMRPGDVAFAISGSGNSANVLKGLQAARDCGALTIGLTGFQGGKMISLCDLCLVVPSDNMQLIEDLHLSVAHALFTVIRSRIKAGFQEIPLAIAAQL